jgi:hypothetical protein
MNVNKKLTREGQFETRSEVELIKSVETGDLMYNSQYGIPVRVADKDYVQKTIDSSIEEAFNNAPSNVSFGLIPETLGEKVTFTRTDYGTEVDIIIPGVLEITRDSNGGGIYNMAQEESYDENVSPMDTSWNSNFTDPTLYGWAKAGNAGDRVFDIWANALDNQVGVNIVGKELILTSNSKFFLIKFTEWTQGGNGGGFSYERTEILTATLFERPYNSPEVVDVISEGLIIKRNNTRGLFNAVLETSYDNNNHTSPKGTRWSSTYTDPINGGSSDLSNVRERVYGTWRDAVDNNPPASIGAQLIMHDLSTDLYWLIVMSVWGIGDNGDLGDVTYTRQLIPLAEGIKFADGTVMTEMPAAGEGPVLDTDHNLIVANNSDGTVNVANGDKHSIPNFSGMLIVNDHYDGRVETWIAGGGDTVCLGATNTGGSPVGSTLTINGIVNGYDWANNDNLTGPFTFTVIKTRNEA